MKAIMPFQGWRLTFFQAVIVAVFLLFTLRMYQLQIVEQDEWELQARDQQLNQLPIPAQRGAIFDRNDERLARNVAAFNVTIVPAELPVSEDETLAIYNRISALVGIPPTRETAIAQGQNVRSIEEFVIEGEGIEPFQPVIVAQDIPRQIAMQIQEELVFMPGVDVQTVAVREYPTGALTTHIVGYMGPIPAEEAEELREQGYNPAFDRIGYEGIERFLEDILAGQRGSFLREVDVAGKELNIIEQIDPIPGQSVRLSLDVELQEVAQQALIDQITLLNTTEERIVTQSGVVIAMNPQTGEILAMVSLPTYDNSRFARAIDGEYYFEIAEDPQRPLVNNAIKSLYPPGSVWKLITAAAVLEEDVIDPNTQLRAEGQLIVENRYAPNDPAASQRFVCWLREGHGNVDMIRGIAWSCDVYFYQIGGGNPNVSEQVLRREGLGITDLFRYSTAMGIGSELGVELPFENPGRMPDRDWKRRNYGEAWSTGDTYNASFGQGYVTVTPLQLLNAVNAIINNGILHQPTIIREFLDEERNITQPFQPQILRTLNIEEVPEDEPLTLLLLEDMLINGETSLACTCEPNSPYYDPLQCDPFGYRGQVDVNDDDFVEDMRPYRVHIPLNYTFNGSVCQPIRFSNPSTPYEPAFLGTESLDITRQGMRAAVIEDEVGRFGTGLAAQENLPYVAIGGKTGTAEYCDDIARPLGLCVPGQWPAHAWFTAYAPFDNPEISVIAFVYNGDEGSRNALPVVVEVMDAYFRLKSEREGTALPTANNP